MLIQISRAKRMCEINIEIWRASVITLVPKPAHIYVHMNVPIKHAATKKLSTLCHFVFDSGGIVAIKKGKSKSGSLILISLKAYLKSVV